MSHVTSEASGSTPLEMEEARAAIRVADVALVAVEQALDRLAAGTYGLCQTCGRQIPFERLEAIPDTKVCVRC